MLGNPYYMVMAVGGLLTIGFILALIETFIHREEWKKFTLHDWLGILFLVLSCIGYFIYLYWLYKKGMLF